MDAQVTIKATPAELNLLRRSLSNELAAVKDAIRNGTGGHGATQAKRRDQAQIESLLGALGGSA